MNPLPAKSQTFKICNLLAGMVLCFTATTSPAANPDTLGLVPLPAVVHRTDGAFKLQRQIRIVADATAHDSGEYLAAYLRTATGLPVQVESISDPASKHVDIFLMTRPAQNNLGEESYRLAVGKDEVRIEAPAAAGIFYGVQTLLQLLPPQAFSSQQASGVTWTIPCVQIEDAPRFKWRGFMLDVSRHFFSKPEIKQTLDFMAWHKLNVFHWHLVDDHGWRIEIKKYPKLTQIGAWRKGIGFDLATNESNAYGPNGCYGGFYTQEDVEEIVAYAKARNITIVPEIEMPGHSTAALAAYPELSCKGGPFDMDLDAGIFNGIYCAGNEDAFKFLEDVLLETFQLFPSEYIHVGGDEVPKDNWKHCEKCQARIKAEGLKNEEELQSYFIRRIQKFVTAHGRKLIGWSEILQGGLAQDSTVMDWNGGGAEAANSGHDVVMASQEFTYYCYYQSLDRPPKLKAARRYLPLDKAYSFNPILAELKPASESHILGVEACQWTVFFASMHEVEEMSFPRLCALAEIGWSPKSVLNYDSFLSRLAVHESRLDQAGIAYWNDHAVKIGEWKPAQINASNGLLEWDVPTQIVVPGKFRLSLNYAKGKHALKINWAALLENGSEVARDTHEGLAGSGYNRPVKARDWNYFLNLPSVKTNAKYSVRVSVSVADDGVDSSGIVFVDPPVAEAKR